MYSYASLNMQQALFVNIKELALGVVWRRVLFTSEVLGKLTPSQELYIPICTVRGLNAV